jgi:hypothetical protein
MRDHIWFAIERERGVYVAGVSVHARSCGLGFRLNEQFQCHPLPFSTRSLWLSEFLPVPGLGAQLCTRGPSLPVTNQLDGNARLVSCPSLILIL